MPRACSLILTKLLAIYTINEIESFMTDPKVVKQFARFITAMYETRKNILYKNTTV